MRIGGRYVLAGQEVECVAIAAELYGGAEHQAAYRDPEHNRFVWRPCEEYQPVAAPVKTLKARCAVAVAPDGAYNIVGWSTATSDDEMAGLTLDSLDRRQALVHFAEIEVPVPTTLELKGQVE